MSNDKSLSARSEQILYAINKQILYAINLDRDAGTVDLVVFDHETGKAAELYLPPALAQQLADVIARHVQLLTE